MAKKKKKCKKGFPCGRSCVRKTRKNGEPTVCRSNLDSNGKKLVQTYQEYANSLKSGGAVSEAKPKPIFESRRLIEDLEGLSPEQILEKEAIAKMAVGIRPTEELLSADRPQKDIEGTDLKPKNLSREELVNLMTELHDPKTKRFDTSDGQKTLDVASNIADAIVGLGEDFLARSEFHSDDSSILFRMQTELEELRALAHATLRDGNEDHARAIISMLDKPQRKAAEMSDEAFDLSKANNAKDGSDRQPNKAIGFGSNLLMDMENLEDPFIDFVADWAALTPTDLDWMNLGGATNSARTRRDQWLGRNLDDVILQPRHIENELWKEIKAKGLV